MAEQEELRRASELAEAKLGVAEEFSWVVALLVGGLVFIKLDSWLFAFVGGAVTYFLATLRYRRQAAEAEDQYFRVAGLGKYARGSGAGGA